VKEPSRNIPLALLGGVLLLIALYCGANLAYDLVLPHDLIVKKNEHDALSSTPIATEFSMALLGPVGGLIASAIVMTSVFGALNGNLMAGPRVLFAAGQDGLAPRALQRIDPRFDTPAVAIAVLAGWSCLLVICVGALTQFQLPVIPLGFTDLDLNLPKGKDPFDVVTDFAMFGAVAFETLAVASIFVFRRRIPPTPENRPYRCWGYPVVPVIYILIMAAVFVNMFVTPEQRSEARIGLGFIGLGAVVYWLAFRKERTP
jgi:amino acid transporter